MGFALTDLVKSIHHIEYCTEKMTQHTLQALRNGDLSGTTRLDLQANLTELPEEVFALADTLEVLNITGNQLTDLPDQLATLKKLKVLFCSNNPFTHVPEVIGECPTLSMVGFKACQIQHVSDNALPPLLRWLILTDNQIQTLPNNLGNHSLLQKCMLAGNQLSSLPESMQQCAHLELLRISANQFNTLPEWLFKLPKLAWLAFAGNPLNHQDESYAIANSTFPTIDWDTLALKQQLGEGASGIIHQATWSHPTYPPKQVAVKLFKGTVTSDGLPESEMAAFIAAKHHHALTAVEGIIQHHPAKTKGIVMALIDASYQILGNPPSLASCTRDVFDNKKFSIQQIMNIALDTAQAVQHLHAQGLIHGDLYAHNILYAPDGKSLLSDFGGASFIPVEQNVAAKLKRVEVRAFGYLLEELIQLHPHQEDSIINSLKSIAQGCLLEALDHRPMFDDIVAQLNAINIANHA